MTVTVVMPSRGRPARAHAAIEAIRETARLISTSVILAVDADDPELDAYRALRWPGRHAAEVVTVVLAPEDTGDLVRATNTVSLRVAADDPTAIIGNLGDDHVCRTPGWDVLIEATLARGPGIAFGDDLLQGAKLPTAPFISAAIVNALGWYALPACRHLYIDDAWLAIGDALGVIHYLPDVVIEHVHPGAGKASWDDGYERANNADRVAIDRAAFHEWRRTGMREALDAVRRIL